MSNVSTCRFEVHPKLLYDVIERQAGTVCKAVAECVQNSIEANDIPSKAVVNITADTNHLTISDNGKGIRNIEEVKEFFLKFGTPHNEKENIIWKQFRMGRGQIFSFGKNSWRTTTFKMDVDIERDKQAEDFPKCELTENLPWVDGCTIDVDLYYPLYSLDSFMSDVRQMIEFVGGKVVFNGEQINTPPRDLKWTYEDENAYYLFSTGGDLSIYNLGCYVMSIPASRAGVTGVIVSKKMLKVNFARNAVMESSCPIWKEINDVIIANRVKKTRNTYRRLTDNEKIAALIDIRDGYQDPQDLMSIGLIKTTSGRSLKFSEILNNTLPWTFAREGDRLADKWLQSGTALVLDDSVLSQLNYRGEKKDFFYWLMGDSQKWNKVATLYEDFDKLTTNLGGDRSYQTIPHVKLTRVEKRIIKVLEGIPIWYGRRIIIGLSGCSYAWTDGSTYIAIDRNYLKQLNLGSYDGTADLFHTLFHELAHDIDTSDTHIHGEEFYRRFHDITYRSNHIYGCPLRLIGELHDRIKTAVYVERQENAEEKEAKAKAKRDKMLKISRIKKKIENVTKDEVNMTIKRKKNVPKWLDNPF